jgi:hypothetical protein
MRAMDDINDLLNEAKAAAARRAAIERESALMKARESGEANVIAERPADANAPTGQGLLTVERRQGQWRCYLAGERIRSGDPVEVYLNDAIGWVSGRLLWGRRPNTPPSVRIDATDPHRIDGEGKPLSIGEIELLLPEDAVCRWPGS